MAGETSILDSLAPVQHPSVGAVSDSAPPTSVLDSLSPVTHPVLGAPTRPQQSAAPDMNWIYESPSEKTSTESPPVQQLGQGPLPSWSNLAGAVPAGLYSGLAKAANLPNAALNTVSGVMKGIGGPDYGTLKMPFEENPGGYQPQGEWATNLHGGAEAVSNTAALGAGAKLLAPLLPAGSAPEIAARAIGNTPPSVIAASAAGGAAENPIAEQVPERLQPIARVGANLAAGGLTSGVEAAAGNAARSAPDIGTAELADMARNTYNIPVRAGQITDNRLIRTADSVLKSVPFSGHGAVDDDAQLALNRAVSQTMGEDSNKITPEVMNAARTRIGGVMNDIGARTNLALDQPALDRLTDISDRAGLAESGLDERQTNQVRAHVDKILDIAGQNGGIVPGDVYQNMTRQGETLHSLQNSNSPTAANLGNEIRRTLDGMLDRSVAPEDADALRQARGQWKAMRTIEPLTLRADVVGGASPATGDIIPSQLRGAVNKSYGRAAFAEPGQLPLNDLANIGQRFMKELNSSQTSERGIVQKMIHGAGEGIIGGMGALGGERMMEHGVGPMTLLAAPLATVGVARGLSSVLRSDMLANRLIRNGMAQTPAQSALGAAGNASIPIAASATTRQLEAPAAPTINPATGLPQFNFKDNHDHAKITMANRIAQKIASGELADDPAIRQWISQNKRELRGLFGGSGIQNIILVTSLLRRSMGDKTKPETLFSALLKSKQVPELSEAMRNAKIETPSELASIAIMEPGFARTLAMKSTRNDVARSNQIRIAHSLKTLMERDDEHGSGNSVPGNDRVDHGGNMGSDNQVGPPKNLIARRKKAEHSRGAEE